MELNEKDFRLLGYLYHGGRESFSKIAKKTGLTRTQVEYKVKKFQEEGIIKKFLTFYNYNALGYPVYVSLNIKLERYSKLNAFTQKLVKSIHCISWGESFGKFDLYANLIFRNEEEISKFMGELMQDKEIVISNYVIQKPYIAEFYPLKLFKSSSGKTFPIVSSGKKEVILDQSELKILKCLEKDARARVIDIANEVKISSELVLYKLKKFKEKNIILGTKIHLDAKKLGYNYSAFFLSIKSLSEEVKKKLILFARDHEKVDALLLSLMSPNCLIQVFHKSEEELIEIIKQVKDLLKNDAFELDVILFHQEEKINTLPFYK